MVTKNFQFFARRAEAVDLLKELTQKHQLWIILPGSKEERLLDCNQFNSVELNAFDEIDRVFIAKNKPTPEQLTGTEMTPAKLGWMMFRLPCESGSLLMLGDFAVKSDWFDKNSETVHENTKLPKLYSKLRADLRKRLSFPVWASNIKTGGVAKYSGIAFSRGASQWEAAGNELRQDGVNNVRFSTKPIAERPARA